MKPPNPPPEVRSSTRGELPGDRAEERYRKLRRRLVIAVRKVCPPWLADRSDDLVQEALISLMRLERRRTERAAEEGGDGGGDEENRELSQSYLMRTAYSKVVDEIRRHRLRQEVPVDEQEGTRSLAHPELDPEGELRRRRLGEAIQECLEALIRPRRLAVTLYFQGHRAKEAAKLLGWGVKRTENLVYRGREDLQTCLEEKGWRR